MFGYDRFDSITTSGMLEAEGLDHTVLCHTDEQAAAFVAGGRVRPDRLAVTGQPRGLSYQRNAALDRMDDGEWALFLVDDLVRVTELDSYDTEAHEVLPVDTKNSAGWGRRFKTPATMARFTERAEQTAQVVAGLGGHLGGFAGIANPLFRSRHWHLNVFCDGRAWVVRKTDLRFDTNVQVIDDVAWTARNLRAFGVVLVNQWVLPDCKRYTAGGYGSIEQRLAEKRHDVQYLTQQYPDLLATKPKKGQPAGTHVVFRRATPPRVRG